jgi:hypothetical protein
MEFSGFMKNTVTNLNPRTMIVSGIAGIGAGGLSHVQTNKAINQSYEIVQQEMPSIEQYKVDIQTNPTDYGFPEGTSVSEMMAREKAIEDISEMSPEARELISMAMINASTDVLSERLVSSAKATYDATQTVENTLSMDMEDIIMSESIEGVKYNEELAMSIMLENGIPTRDEALAKKKGFLSPSEFRTAYLIESQSNINKYFELPMDGKEAI